MAHLATPGSVSRSVSTLAVVTACALMGFWLVFPFAWAIAERTWELENTQWLLGGIVGIVHAAVILAGRRQGRPWDLVAMGLVGSSVGALSAIVPIVEDNGGEIGWLAVGLITFAAGLLLLHLVPRTDSPRTPRGRKRADDSAGPE
ncbi:MAG TPA: hypothetical protein VI796_00175 [Candidatus Thermoplasmatota archaeon]|nr:hypothetical protein [Candidatus Thermoplasmatota archaeon]